MNRPFKRKPSDPKFVFVILLHIKRDKEHNYEEIFSQRAKVFCQRTCAAQCRSAEPRGGKQKQRPEWERCRQSEKQPE